LRWIVGWKRRGAAAIVTGAGAFGSIVQPERRMNADFLRRRARVALLLCLATGCYRYVPLTPGAAPPPRDAEVRFGLTQAGAAALTPVLGRGTIAVEGRVAAVTDTAYVVSMSATLKPAENGNDRTVWAGEMVSIPRASIASAESRTLDRGRTATLFGVGAVAAAIVVKLVVHTLGSGGSGGDTGGTVVTP